MNHTLNLSVIGGDSKSRVISSLYPRVCQEHIYTHFDTIAMQMSVVACMHMRAVEPNGGWGWSLQISGVDNGPKHGA